MSTTQPTDSLRVGSREREETVERLSRAHTEGQLDMDELDQRIAAATQAKTRSDLATLLEDLPPDRRGRSRGTTDSRAVVARSVATLRAVWGNRVGRLALISGAGALVSLFVVALLLGDGHGGDGENRGDGPREAMERAHGGSPDDGVGWIAPVIALAVALAVAVFFLLRRRKSRTS